MLNIIKSEKMFNLNNILSIYRKKTFFSDNFLVLNIVKISETTPFCKITEKLTEESNHFEEHITTEKLDQNT